MESTATRYIFARQRSQSRPDESVSSEHPGSVAGGISSEIVRFGCGDRREANNGAVTSTKVSTSVHVVIGARLRAITPSKRQEGCCPIQWKLTLADMTEPPRPQTESNYNAIIK